MRVQAGGIDAGAEDLMQAGPVVKARSNLARNHGMHGRTVVHWQMLWHAMQVTAPVCNCCAAQLDILIPI